MIERVFCRVLNRRQFLTTTFCASGVLLPNSVRSEVPIGSATAVRGRVVRRRDAKLDVLLIGENILNEDTVSTGDDGFADLELEGKTRIVLGNQTELLIDRFIASQGGTLELGTGRMVFDYPESSPKMNLTVRTAFGMIGVRGTKFFCGPNRNVFAVFVERGQVAVSAAGVTQLVGRGEGVDIALPGAAPSNFAVWGEPRIVEAYASVGLSR